MSKELLKKLIDKMSDEEVAELLGTEPPKKKNKRGRGGRKKKGNKPASTHNIKRGGGRQAGGGHVGENKFPEMLKKMKLSQSEKTELKEAKKADAEAKPAHKESRGSSLANVKCDVCGKRDKVSPSLVYGSYKCNDCIVGAKS